MPSTGLGLYRCPLIKSSQPPILIWGNGGTHRPGNMLQVTALVSSGVWNPAAGFSSYAEPLRAMAPQEMGAAIVRAHICSHRPWLWPLHNSLVKLELFSSPQLGKLRPLKCTGLPKTTCHIRAEGSCPCQVPPWLPTTIGLSARTFYALTSHLPLALSHP